MHKNTKSSKRSFAHAAIDYGIMTVGTVGFTAALFADIIIENLSSHQPVTSSPKSCFCPTENNSTDDGNDAPIVTIIKNVYC